MMMTDRNHPFRDPATPLGIKQAELRKRTLKEIENDPAGFDMTEWEHRKQPNQYKNCNTTRCIGGWAQFLARGAVYEDGDEAAGIPPTYLDAIGLLGLTVAEYGSDKPGLHGDPGALFFLPGDQAVERLRELAGA